MLTVFPLPAMTIVVYKMLKVVDLMALLDVQEKHVALEMILKKGTRVCMRINNMWTMQDLHSRRFLFWTTIFYLCVAVLNTPMHVIVFELSLDLVVVLLCLVLVPLLEILMAIIENATRKKRRRKKEWKSSMDRYGVISLRLIIWFQMQRCCVSINWP